MEFSKSIIESRNAKSHNNIHVVKEFTRNVKNNRKEQNIIIDVECEIINESPQSREYLTIAKK